jgi:hypothetical protein
MQTDKNYEYIGIVYKGGDQGGDAEWLKARSAFRNWELV